MPRITAFFTDDGAPLTSPANAPTIRIRRQDTGALVVTDAAMTELGDGLFAYDYAENPTLEYTFRCDGDPTAAGQVTAQERYVAGSFSGITEARIEADIPAILVDTGTSLPADVATRAAPGDAMDLVTDAVDADAVATSGANEVRDAILFDSTPFAGANVDAAVSSRAAPGDQMALTAAAIAAIGDQVLLEPVGDHDSTADSLAAVLRRISHHATARAKINTSNAVQWTVDVYEDDDPSTVTEQFAMKYLDGSAVNDATPLTDPVLADLDPS